MRPSEVSLTGGAIGLGTVRGGPYQDDVVAHVHGLFDPNRPPITVGGYSTSYGHFAIDVVGGQGAPILSVGDGVVDHVQTAGAGHSNLIYIDHENGWSSRYLHLMHPPTLVRGQRVNSGDVLGLEDTTGIATGSHLHFELRLHNSPVDPLTALLIGPDLLPAAAPLPAPQAGDASPALTLNVLQQLQALLGNGTVVFPQTLTPANGDERYYSIKDGQPRLLPAGALTRWYSIYIPLEEQP